MRVKSNSLLAVLVGLTLNIGFSSAATAAPATLTITGFIGNSVTPEDVPLQHNLSAWFGKAYTLEMTYDADGVVGTLDPVPDFPGLILNKWAPVPTSHSFVIDDVLVSAFAVSDGTYASVETFNDFIMPLGTFPGAPSGIVGGHTYDSYLLSADGVGFGCVDGACDSADDIYEAFRMTPQYFWDVSQVNAITDSNLPNVQGGAFSNDT